MLTSFPLTLPLALLCLVLPHLLLDGVEALFLGHYSSFKLSDTPQCLRLCLELPYRARNF